MTKRGTYHPIKTDTQNKEKKQKHIMMKLLIVMAFGVAALLVVTILIAASQDRSGSLLAEPVAEPSEQVATKSRLLPRKGFTLDKFLDAKRPIEFTGDWSDEELQFLQKLEAARSMDDGRATDFLRDEQFARWFADATDKWIPHHGIWHLTTAHDLTEEGIMAIPPLPIFFTGDGWTDERVQRVKKILDRQNETFQPMFESSTD
jgi:hypothetical protein